MKKAKLMLSALGVCALLATAFAFKAQTFSGHQLYINNSGTGTGCTELFNGKTFTTATTGTQVRASIASTSDCPLTYTANIAD